MSDKLILENYLLILKSTVEVYVHGTLEASNNNVKNLLNNHLDSILKLQGNLYELMTKYNFYNVENIDNKEIEKTMNNLLK